jgi:hypothetical protein
MEASACNQGIEDRVRIWIEGVSAARWQMQPSRMFTDVGFSSAAEKSGVPHSGQKAWIRRFPLCATFT